MAVLALLKLGLVFHQIWGAEGVEPPLRMLGKALLLLGEDVVGAAAVALLAAASARKGWWVAVQALHGAGAALSTLSMVEIGGPVNRQFIGMALMQAEDWSSQMGASTADYLGGKPILLIVVAAGLGALLALRPHRAWRNELADAPGRWARRILLAEVLATWVLVPLFAGGWLGVRMHTHGLESSPWVELAASYARPAARELLAGEADEAWSDGFRFDWSSVAKPHGDAPVSTPLEQASPRRTNLVVILLESIGRRYLDDPADPMPWLRALRDRPGAVELHQHYATWSLTTKALFSVLCGEMPWPTYRSISFVNPAIPCVSLSEALGKAGWHTAFITPSDLDYDRKMRFLRHRGFDTVWDSKNIPGHEGAWRGAWGLEDRIAVDAILKYAAERKAAEPQRPFFVLFEQLAGHHPFIATEAQEKDPSPDRIGNYFRSLRTADDATRATVEGLEALGLLRDTLIVVVADHGEGHGRLAGRNAYEPVVRVPAFLLGPQTAGATPGARATATTSMIDLPPTLLSLLDVPIPCTMKGRDLTRPSEARLALFGGRPPRFQIGVADGRWNYILEDGFKEMLFDIAADPDETNDLAHLHPELTAAYKERIEAWEHHSAGLIDSYAERMEAARCAPP